MNIGYTRIYATGPSETEQIKSLCQFNVDKWFKEMPSNVQLEKMLDFAKEGDTIYTFSLNVIAKSSIELQNLIEVLDNRKINIVTVKEDLNSTSNVGKMLLQTIKIVLDFEKSSILERQKEGIEVAKQNGKYLGRQPSKVDVKSFNGLYEDFLSKKITKMQFAENIGITRPTLDKFIKAYETDAISECDGYYFVETIKTAERKN